MSIRSTMLINGGIATLSAILFNSILIFLVLKYTISQMKGYGRLILLHSINDICLDLIQFSIGGVRYLTLIIIYISF
jgi:hypothetical protein